MLLLVYSATLSLWSGGGGVCYGLGPGCFLRYFKLFIINLYTDIIVCKMCFDSEAVDELKRPSDIDSL